MLTAILSLYSVIGAVLLLSQLREGWVYLMVNSMLFVVIPLIGVYGMWRRNRTALLLTLLFFGWQSIRRVNSISWLSERIPISLSWPVGDFANGHGVLLDFFAMIMMVLIIWQLVNIRRTA